METAMLRAGRHSVTRVADGEPTAALGRSPQSGAAPPGPGPAGSPGDQET